MWTRQKQWDKEHAQIDRQVEQRKEHLRSDAPEARQFRAQAQQQYGAEHTAWEKARERATAHFETNRGEESNMANDEHERKQQQ